MRCNSAISHHNNLANFLFKSPPKRYISNNIQISSQQSCFEGCVLLGSAHMNSSQSRVCTLKVPRTLKSYSCIPSVFPDTHIVGSKTKSKHFQKCAKSSKRTPYFFAKAHVFTITTLLSD